MKKIILIGRSESGKTTLIQALRGEKVHYEKTQYVRYDDLMIDTPGEYLQSRSLGGALAIYSFESDMVGLLVAATEPYTLMSPNVVSLATREVIGIVTKVNEENADVALADRWLQNAGCKKIFHVDSVTGFGIAELYRYLAE